MTNLTLALDAMGGDHGPQVTVPAALQALRLHPKLSLLLVGDETQISPYLSSAEIDVRSRITLVHTTEVVRMDDKPATALRHAKNSSMRLAIEQVRDGMADGCVSAGNTGALMAMAKVLLKMLPGVDRPALVSCLPAINGKPVYLLDLGANIQCDYDTLFQFAVMGSVLSEAVDKIARPKVALLNVGIEECKGNGDVQQAAQLLLHTPQLNYAGFIEGDEIYSGKVDVIVCDGFVGNITLKTSEGIARLLVHQLKQGLAKGFVVRILARLLAPRIQKVLNQMNPDHYNGASLLGLRAVVVKSHGNADEHAYIQAISLAYTEAKRRLPEMIKDRLESILLDINS
ncbi:phosphate acyltransferase PlsX [Shewanella amazonensis]|uniref:Phosphate acyltransferase n=1 Tax=Shewanella amazonensis (strain ATCC BAA-1098 / SB2B) TaxID=326297 RepID=PLSX_SHEAM|nr:phosphate acyltransferase PlsX [Shewanella amazonensis]A1S732.1 RecName: Full=Phosphate acyltransferase; AltName: Full=Acyl-ACP phosphotransacylase; AltName: Full=Acyl-[acyl-carrier-protein]--phosphate acyltransferase; AltName: Full=Phosphate-acyl-ACP acyltransferase [Shewanella amazonensis SB2B]ABM00189.1 phosphate:acyl-[acyl carrier protein] acyltransferase [Shewanella amazonensis SB2B]